MHACMPGHVHRLWLRHLLTVCLRQTGELLWQAPKMYERAPGGGGYLMMFLMLAVQLSLRWLATLSVAANWTCSNSSRRMLLDEKLLNRDTLTTCARIAAGDGCTRKKAPRLSTHVSADGLWPNQHAPGGDTAQRSLIRS